MSTPQEDLKKLANEVHDKLNQLRKMSVEANIPACVYVGHNMFQVYVQNDDYFDEELRNFMEREYRVEVGNWISSSEMC